MQLQNILSSCAGHLSVRTARSIVARFKMALITRNEYGGFDVLLHTGEVIPSIKTLVSALDRTPRPCIIHFPTTGEFDVREKAVSIQCVLCEGAGERSKWEVCPERDRRCEAQHSDGYDGGGWPIWEYQTCKSCSGAGGADKTHRCGFCSGDGYVECEESALMESDTLVEKAMVAK